MSSGSTLVRFPRVHDGSHASNVVDSFEVTQRRHHSLPECNAIVDFDTSNPQALLLLACLGRVTAWLAIPPTVRDSFPFLCRACTSLLGRAPGRLIHLRGTCYRPRGTRETKYGLCVFFPAQEFSHVACSCLHSPDASLSFFPLVRFPCRCQKSQGSTISRR